MLDHGGNNISITPIAVKMDNEINVKINI